MRKARYLIIDNDDGCTEIVGEDMVHAVRRYVSLCGLIITHTDFERITRGTPSDMLINTFNNLCEYRGDRIKRIYTNFDTVYNGGAEVTE